MELLENNNKILLQNAIESGKWIKSYCNDNLSLNLKNRKIDFQFRILSFFERKLFDLKQLDGIKTDLKDNKLWKLDIELMNLSKNKINPHSVYNKIYLIDSNGRKFTPITPAHPIITSQHSKQIKLNSFFPKTIWSFGNSIKPNKSKMASLTYLLPDENLRSYTIFIIRDFNDIFQNMPSCKSNTNFVEPDRNIPSHVRREVWRRDQGKCVKCGNRKNLEFDHIIPFSKGGSNTARNIELLCQNCNRAKSSKVL